MTVQHPEERTVLKFSEYLRQLPSAWLFEHFLPRTRASRKILSSEALHDCGRQFSRPEALRRQLESLEPADRLRCGCAYLMGRTGLCADEGRGDLNDPLVRSFLVYAARGGDGSRRYFGFTEFEPHLRPALATTIAAGAAVPAGERADFLGSGSGVRDVAAAVTLASQGLLKKKQRGGIMRNGLLRLDKLTHDIPEKPGPELYARLTIGFACGAGLLRENREGYWCCGAEFEEWLAGPESGRAAALQGFAAGFAGSWSLDLLRASVRETTSGQLSSAVFHPAQRSAAAESLWALHWAGLVALARAGSKTLYFGLPAEDANGTHARGAAADGRAAVVVMPDFSAIIAPEAPPSHLYRFGRLGELQSLDKVYNGRIERAVLNNALAGGLAGETALAWLDEWRVPSNVVETVREWIREFYRLYITDRPMLIVTDEKVASQVDEYEPLRQHLERMPSRTVFCIKRGAENRVKELLSSMGFDHRMPSSDSFVPDPETPGAVARESAETWQPVVAKPDKAAAARVSPKGGKYGSGLKAYDQNETMHIIDYALLTGAGLALEYAGSPLLKRGIYSVAPCSCSAADEPTLEAVDGSGRKRLFVVKKILKIGVENRQQPL